MRAKEFITERVLNLFDRPSKERMADKVWAMLQHSYGNLPGGFATASTIEELIKKSSLWKVVVRNGEPTAAILYKDQFGRKGIASCQDGSKQGIRDYMMIRNADTALDRSWAEVSGKPEAVMAKSGAKKIPAKFAHILTKKNILSYNPDGYHYTRLINGHPHEKVIYGAVRLSPSDVDYLVSQGISLHDLPTNLAK